MFDDQGQSIYACTLANLLLAKRINFEKRVGLIKRFT